MLTDAKRAEQDGHRKHAACAVRRFAGIHGLHDMLPSPHHADNRIEGQTMIHRILLAGLTMMVLAGCVPANSGYVRDDYDYDRGHREYRRGCENCGQILRIESIGQRGTSGGGAVLGAIIGGALGNQVGKGDGRRLATVAGAIGGGLVGREIDRRREGGKLTSDTKRVCRNETRPSSRVVGYDVQYRADGLLLSKRLEHDPGDRLLIGQRERVVGYEVSWRYRDQRGSLRMDHDPGSRLPVRDGVVIPPDEHLAVAPAG